MNYSKSIIASEATFVSDIALSDYYSTIQSIINNSNEGETIKIGHDIVDEFILSQPLILKSNTNYIIDGTLKVINGEIVSLATDTVAGESTVEVSLEDINKFSVGQWISITDDYYTLNIEGTLTIRDLRYAWGGKILDITNNIITLEGSFTYGFRVSENGQVGHSQGCILIENAENINISGSGIIDGNRDNQIAVLPASSLTLHGFWENFRCASTLVIWQSKHVTVNDVTVINGLSHSFVVSSGILGSSVLTEDITISGVTAKTGHDKNFVCRKVDNIKFYDVIAYGGDGFETWEDGLIFYADCTNCIVDGLISENNKRYGFCWNSDTNQYLTANNITTKNNGRIKGYGFDIDSKLADITNVYCYDTLRIGGPYEVRDVTITNLLVESSPPTYPNDVLVNIGGTRITINNLIIQNSKSKINHPAIVITGTDIVINGTGIYNHTGQIITQTSYDNAEWNNFEGIIIT